MGRRRRDHLYRLQAARADKAALRELLLRVSPLVAACPDAREMDLDPVNVLENGACVVDARVRGGRRPCLRSPGGSCTSLSRSD
ncbi:MAG: acetate--CoA ligase family protein [Thermoanaerobaculia bacterium]